MTEPTKDQQDNWHLCNVIREYHEAYQAVLKFTNNYIHNGGDLTRVPVRWQELDELRHEKYMAMINAAGLTS